MSQVQLHTYENSNCAEKKLHTVFPIRVYTFDDINKAK